MGKVHSFSRFKNLHELSDPRSGREQPKQTRGRRWEHSEKETSFTYTWWKCWNSSVRNAVHAMPHKNLAIEGRLKFPVCVQWRTSLETTHRSLSTERRSKAA